MTATARAISVDFALNLPQRRAFAAIAPRQTVCIPWGRGVGKSWFMRNIAWLLVAQHYGKDRAGALKPLRGIRIVALMDTHKHFGDVHRAGMLEELANDWSFLGGKVNKTTLRVDFPDGSWFQPFPAEQHTSKSALGLRCDVVIFDECDDISKGVFDTVCRPWFSEPWSLKIRLAGGTPRMGRNGLLYHLYRLGQSQESVHERYKSFHATYEDAPETVDLAEVEDARENSPPAIFKREWLCDFDAAEGLVYGDVFREDFHVRSPPVGLRLSEIIIGGDFGYEDPGVLLVIGISGHGHDAVAWVLEEICKSKETQTYWLGEMRAIMARFPQATLYHDPSAKGLIVAYQREAHARPRDVDNTIHDGISAVADRLKIHGKGDERTARLYVAPQCRNTIYEFGAYHRRRDRLDADRYTEDIVDRDNHCMDALRYAVFNGMSRPSSRRRTSSIEE